MIELFFVFLFLNLVCLFFSTMFFNELVKEEFCNLNLIEKIECVVYILEFVSAGLFILVSFIFGMWYGDYTSRGEVISHNWYKGQYYWYVINTIILGFNFFFIYKRVQKFLVKNNNEEKK
jgi:hypothetical protein